MKTAVVTGAGGFIGHHLVSYLKDKGYYVRGIDIKAPEFEPTRADEFRRVDLRNENSLIGAGLTRVDELYHLAADMGGMGFIQDNAPSLMQNNTRINLNTLEFVRATRIPKFFFSSSVCVYPNMTSIDAPIDESAAVPAHPDNFYGWEKLYFEQVLKAHEEKYGLHIRIARFENCYGPMGTWRGGREKAPAAICRKVAEAFHGLSFDVWGDGTARRVFTYVDDMVAGIYALMQSDLQGAVNLGSTQDVSIRQLAELVVEISGKNVTPVYVDGPVGVQARNFKKDRAHSLGWSAETNLYNGLGKTYAWIADQVAKERVRGN